MLIIPLIPIILLNPMVPLNPITLLDLVVLLGANGPNGLLALDIEAHDLIGVDELVSFYLMDKSCTMFHWNPRSN